MSRSKELEAEFDVLRKWIAAALVPLGTLSAEDSEDGGAELQALITSGTRLICKHPAKQETNFTYGYRARCPDCGWSVDDWWD